MSCLGPTVCRVLWQEANPTTATSPHSLLRRTVARHFSRPKALSGCSEPSRAVGTQESALYWPLGLRLGDRGMEGLSVAWSPRRSQPARISALARSAIFATEDSDIPCVLLWANGHASVSPCRGYVHRLSGFSCYVHSGR